MNTAEKQALKRWPAPSNETQHRAGVNLATLNHERRQGFVQGRTLTRSELDDFMDLLNHHHSVEAAFIAAGFVIDKGEENAQR